MIGGGELGGKDEVEGEEGDGFKNSRVKDIGEISFVGGGVGGLVSVDIAEYLFKWTIFGVQMTIVVNSLL